MEAVVEGNELIVEGAAGSRRVNIYSKEGYRLLSELWVKSGWQQGIFRRFTWLGLPILQLAEDVLLLQELIYNVRPHLIIETGTARGGGAIFYASMLELLGRGRVISIDVRMSIHDRQAVQSHPMARRVSLIEGSSTDPDVAARIRQTIEPGEQVLVALDADHTYAHVRQELEQYAGLVTPGSYAVVFDGVVAMLTDAPNGSPQWATDNPARAIEDFLQQHPEFEADPDYNRAGVTYCPGGFLRRKREA